jgi:hypothetical protein
MFEKWWLRYLKLQILLNPPFSRGIGKGYFSLFKTLQTFSRNALQI